MINRRVLGAAFAAIAMVLAVNPAAAANAKELDAAADATLEQLKATQPVTEKMIADAAGILIFPEILKGGFVVGVAGGDGVLRVKGETHGYYTSVAASWGLQAGITKFGYVMFLMDDAALAYVRDTSGWEIGVGPNVTMVDAGVAAKLSTTTAQDGVYVFFVDQSGFFAGAGLEGTKISKSAE